MTRVNVLRYAEDTTAQQEPPLREFSRGSPPGTSPGEYRALAGLAEGSGHEPRSGFAYQERMTRCPKRRHLRKEAGKMADAFQPIVHRDSKFCGHVKEVRPGAWAVDCDELATFVRALLYGGHEYACGAHVAEMEVMARDAAGLTA